MSVLWSECGAFPRVDGEEQEIPLGKVSLVGMR